MNKLVKARHPAAHDIIPNFSMSGKSTLIAYCTVVPYRNVVRQVPRKIHHIALFELAMGRVDYETEPRFICTHWLLLRCERFPKWPESPPPPQQPVCSDKTWLAFLVYQPPRQTKQHNQVNFMRRLAQNVAAHRDGRLPLYAVHTAAVDRVGNQPDAATRGDTSRAHSHTSP